MSFLCVIALKIDSLFLKFSGFCVVSVISLLNELVYVMPQVFVKDVWKEYTGWPLNNMERSYKFMVKHVQLWKVAFHSTSPRWIHSVYLAAIAAYYAK